MLRLPDSSTTVEVLHSSRIRTRDLRKVWRLRKRRRTREGREKSPYVEGDRPTGTTIGHFVRKLGVGSIETLNQMFGTVV